MSDININVLFLLINKIFVFHNHLYDWETYLAGKEKWNLEENQVYILLKVYLNGLELLIPN